MSFYCEKSTNLFVSLLKSSPPKNTLAPSLKFSALSKIGHNGPVVLLLADEEFLSLLLDEVIFLTYAILVFDSIGIVFL